MKKHFNIIKKAYFEAREYEWERLREYLKSKKLKIVIRGNGGCGSKTYCSNNKLKVTYDLSNWRWIDIALENGDMVFISFQPFDKDSDSNSTHALFDRIGISRYKKRENNTREEKYRETKEITENMLITDVELPFDDDKMERIYKIIRGFNATT